MTNNILQNSISTENIDTNPNKNQESTQMLRKDKQFLLHMCDTRRIKMLLAKQST